MTTDNTSLRERIDELTLDYDLTNTAIESKHRRGVLDDNQAAGRFKDAQNNLRDNIVELVEAEVLAARVQAREELALEFIEQLDSANVPQEVQIPKFVGDDLTQISVPVVSADYWRDIHLALKYMREATTDALRTNAESGNNENS